MEIKRLDLGHLYVTARAWPVHGYVILHEQLGVVLVDTGCGGPDEVLRYYRVVNRTIAVALGDHGLAPSRRYDGDQHASALRPLRAEPCLRACATDGSAFRA